MRREHHLVWERKKILLTLNRDWNGSIEQKDVEIWQLQDRCSVEMHLRNSYWFLFRWGSLHWCENLEECQTSAFDDMDKGWDCTAKTPTWNSKIPSEKPIFQSLLKVTTNPCGRPARGSVRLVKVGISLCHEACTLLPRCAYNLWNSCFVEIMQFFGPWFYERQYFHNPVYMDSKWLHAETNGTGTNEILDGKLYTLPTSQSP